ncbi:MAG TPA: glycosyltransferase family 4 protein [Gemmatimonadaceae bacterium]
MTAPLRNIFVTQNFPPESGGMARRHAELVGRYGEPMDVSTVARNDAASLDSSAPYRVERQAFPLSGAKLFGNEIRWGRWLARRCATDVDVIHCGEIRPVGYAVWWAHKQTHVPYMIYVNGGDLLRERQKTTRRWSKRQSAYRLLSDASGVVANSEWSAALTRDIMRGLGIAKAPPVAAIDLGTDPDQFHRSHDTGRLRTRWGVTDAPIMISVARLVPHKGQDVAIQALAALSAEFPLLHYVLVGKGDDEVRLRQLAAALNAADRVHFVGQLSDADLAEAYATSNVYVGLSRLDKGINVEGFGISFVEAAASGLPVVAGDSGGVRSAVRDGETGVVVPPMDFRAAAAAIGGILRDAALAERMALAGRALVESHYNWDRVATDTREFVHNCIAGSILH